MPLKCTNLGGSTIKRILLSITILIAALSSANAQQLAPEELEVLKDSLEDVKPDYSRQIKVEGMTLKRGGGEFFLKRGYLTPGYQVMGRDFILVFKGLGYFRITPPIDAEKVIMAEFCRDSTIDWRIDEAIFVFADSTFALLRDTLTFESDAKKQHEDRVLDEYLDDYTESFGEDLMLRVLGNLRAPARAGVFVARFRDDRDNKMTYFFEPKMAESTILFKREEVGGGEYEQSLVSQFGLPEWYESDPWFSTPALALLRKLSYDIDLKFDENGGAHISAQVEFVPGADLGQVLPIRLDATPVNLTIESPVNDSLKWIRDSLTNEIAVHFAEPLITNHRYLLEFDYSYSQISNRLFLNMSWHPSTYFADNTLIKARVSCPDTTTVLAPGYLDKTVLAEGEVQFKFDFHTDHLFSWPLVVGRYLSVEDTTSTGVVISVSSPIFADTMQIYNLLDSLKHRSVEIVEFYQDFLGFSPTSRISVVGGIMPPLNAALGLVPIQQNYFADLIGDYSRFVLAFQLARQWSSGAIALESYREKWLVSGLATYVAIYYLEQSDISRIGSFDSFLKWVNFMNDHVPDYSTPLWLANRTSSELAGLFRNVMVRFKGAYIFHMLRFMMMDVPTLDDTRFRNLLYEFVQECRGRNAATSVLVDLTSRHMAEDFDWFFRQYLMYAEVPRYLWSVTLLQDTDQPTIDVEVTTEGVRPGFRMLVPFAVKLADGRQTMVMLDIRLPHQTFRLRLPGEPVNYRFNVYRAALCTEKEVTSD